MSRVGPRSDKQSFLAEGDALVLSGESLLEQLGKPTPERSVVNTTWRNALDVEELTAFVGRYNAEDLTGPQARILVNSFSFLSPLGGRYWLLGLMIFATKEACREEPELDPLLESVGLLHLKATLRPDIGFFSEFSPAEVSWMRRWLLWAREFECLYPETPTWLDNYPESERVELEKYNPTFADPRVEKIEEMLRLPPFSTLEVSTK